MNVGRLFTASFEVLAVGTRRELGFQVESWVLSRHDDVSIREGRVLGLFVDGVVGPRLRNEDGDGFEVSSFLCGPVKVG